METVTDEARQTQIEALVRHGRMIKAEIAELKTDLDAITGKIDELVPVGWNYTVDGVPAVKRAGNRKFNPLLAVKQFTEEEQVACIVKQLDTKLVRELAEQKGIIEECMDPSDKSVVAL